ncbi:hydantoinase/oxoprolinase family protein [Halofilum ochraceum]|uniref:hydantoinase/oxoprolinase family protein n=1 Tax=Halofilum ochraceum TaxID=1611323 RepID=UPI0008311E3E|nr:hydantoinase/oxoprolinase family protein [Halofilum ochraceum]
MGLTLGIDTGGTYTDAVLVDAGGHVRASAKALTSHDDLSRGIGEALDSVLAVADQPIGLVSVSTTLATNAVVEGEGQRVALILVGEGREVLERGGLGSALGRDRVEFVAGGHDGSGTERAPFDSEALEAAMERHAGAVSAFAVAARFAVRNPAHERRARQLIAERTGLPVSCGHQLSGALDAPRRALTALLNARLIPLLTDLIGSVRGLLDNHGIEAPLMVVRGDGSLVTAELALQAPVETILSGPAASLVGARHLAAEANAVVFDMGGTTSDIGVLENGEPRRHREGAVIGGWRTRVDAVEVHTCGLGGDSEITLAFAPPFHIGPHRLIPLSQLAARVPGVLETLRVQAEEVVLREHAGRFAVRRRAPIGGPDTLSRSQRLLWDRLADGPLDLVTLFAEQTRQRALDRLVEQGIVGLAGFTPTDAAHVLGWHTLWSAEAAELGAAMLIRSARYKWGRDLGTPQAFAARVIDTVGEDGARHAFMTALADSEVAPDGVPAPGARALIDRAIGARPPLSAVNVGMALRWPLVAIGAPAAAYGEAIARRLGTRCVVPPYAEVANAVGAVIAGVVQRVTATITPLAGERFRVHTAHGISTLSTLEEAWAWAEAEAERLATRQAELSGAGDISVSSERSATTGHADDGSEIFFEGVVTATARGPALNA